MKIIAKFLFFFFLCVLLSQPVVADDVQNTFAKQYPCKIDRVDSLIGSVYLGLGDEKMVKMVMPCLFQLWRENYNMGSGNFDVSNAFLALMEANPNAFLEAMVTQKRILSEWLNDLPDLSFTWADKPPCRLEEKRKQLILLLKNAKTSQHVSKIKEIIIEKLSKIHCRQIQ